MGGENLNRRILSPLRLKASSYINGIVRCLILMIKETWECFTYNEGECIYPTHRLVLSMYQKVPLPTTRFFDSI